MKPQVPRFPRRAMLALLVLTCIASPLLTACGPAAATPARQPTTAPAAAPSKETTPVQPAAASTAAPAATSTVVPPPLPAGHILLPTGGRLIVPEGALPPSVQILARLTCTPLLRTGAEAVGPAVAIRAEGVPSQPLTLRLPAPAGAADLEQAFIARVEPSGVTTYLMTELEGQELVATTPGFGTFFVVRIESGRKPTLAGPDTLLPGEEGVFAPLHSAPLYIEDGRWRSWGALSLLHEGRDAAVVIAGAGPAEGGVSYEFQDMGNGRRWFGSRSVRIVSGAEGYAGQPFKVSVSALTPMTYAGDEVIVGAAVYGDFQPPVTWSWDFGDGESGGPVTTEGSASSFELPAKRYDTSVAFTDYTVTVTVRDARGAQVRGSAPIRVLIWRGYYDPTYQLALEGPLRLAWPGKAALATYTVKASGGVPPHMYTLLLSGTGQAAIESGESLSREFQFNEPGEYQVVAMGRESQSDHQQAILLLRVLVEGRQPLRATIQGLPARAAPGQRLEAKIGAIGGILRVAGAKGGYTVTIDWGDGSAPQVETEVGLDNWAAWGSETAFNHSYARAGTYTVRLEVCDATGWSETVTQEIVITGTAAPVAAAPTLSAPPAVPTVQVAGRTVALATGGSVFVPEGALPAGAQIRASRTQMPALPDDVQPVGDALLITATDEPKLPVTLRLPVPPGVTDPDNLAILRVQENGNTTFLMTRVENNELLAETLGFSTYVRVRVDRSWSASMVGNESLHTGQQSTYLFNSSNPEARVARWRAHGEATLVGRTDRMATVRAGSEPGHAWLWYIVEWPAARDIWEGWKGILIVDPALAAQSFGVTVVARPSVAHIGRDTVSIVATAQGDYEAPIWWAWQFQAGGGGQVQTDSGTLELPAGKLPPQDQPGIYIVRIWAEDAQHRVHESWGGYELLPAEPFRVSVSGPERVRWSDPAAFEGYTASASGGEPPYVFRFQLFPGADPSRPISFTRDDTATVKFDQPGQYRLQVTAMDRAEEVTQTSFPIVVEGGEPLSTRIVALPATAAVNAQVAATISIRGGVLVAGAKKAGYRLVVDWGDGSAPLVEEDVGLKITPYQGITFSKSHSYSAARQYTVRIQASDATGKSDWYAQEITISRAPAAAPTTPAPQPTARGTQLVWVRQGPAEFKYGKDAPWYEPNPLTERAGSFDKGTTSATSIVVEEKLVANRVQVYHLVFTANFDEPPQILVPGQQYKVRASVSHTGTNERGGEAPGIQASFVGDGYTIEPNEALRYYPFRSPPPASSKEWTISAPQRVQPGATYWIEARTPSHPKLTLRWTYRAEYR